MMSTRHVLQIPSEDVIQEIESSKNCIINRNFNLPWFHSKQDPPQIGHIYSEIGQRDIFPVVDTNGFDEVSLQSTSGGGSSVSTAYRVPGAYTVEHSGTKCNIVDSEKHATPNKVPVTVSSPLIIKKKLKQCDSLDKLRKCDNTDKLKKCDSTYKQISVKNIVCYVTFIVTCLFLLSIMSTLSSLRRETNMERMGNVTQEKRLIMSQKSALGNLVTSDRDTAATSATYTVITTPTTGGTTSASSTRSGPIINDRDTPVTSATDTGIDAPVTSATDAEITTPATRATTTVRATPATSTTTTRGQPPTASNLPPTILTPPPTILPPTRTPRTTTRTTSETTKKWYRW